MKTYLCFHCLENLSSQLWYGAFSLVASMEWKCLTFQYHMVTYEIDVSEMLTTEWFIHWWFVQGSINFSPFSLLFFVICQLGIGNFCWNFSCQIYFSLTVATIKWLQLEALPCSTRCSPTPVSVNSF